MSARPAFLLLLPLLLPPPAVAIPADHRFELADSLALLTSSADSALLYLVREQFVRPLHPLPPENLYLDAAPLALLPQRAYVALRIGPGPHRLWSVGGPPDFWLDVLPGQACLVRFRETLERNDQITADWVLDDPGALPGLVRSKKLLLARLTAKGEGFLRARGRRRLEEHAAGPPSGGGPRLPLQFPEVWRESPLDRVNLENDFLDLAGRLTLDSSGIRHESRRLGSVHIPFRDILRVAYAGTRFTGTQPWLLVHWLTPDGPRLECFADARALYAAETYNRLFAAVARRLHELRPGSGATPLQEAAAPESR